MPTTTGDLVCRHAVLKRHHGCKIADHRTEWNDVRGTKSKPIPGPHLVYGFLTTEPNGVVAPIHPKAMLMMMGSRSLHGEPIRRMRRERDTPSTELFWQWRID
jgi:hypothetical protein